MRCAVSVTFLLFAACGGARVPSAPPGVTLLPPPVPAPATPCPRPPPPPPRPPLVVEQEPPPPPQPPWSAAPEGSRALVFREAYMGMLPAKATRTTWTMITQGREVVLRVEVQRSVSNIPELDRASLNPDAWRPATRTEYAGDASAASPPFTIELRRAFGAGPEALSLRCASASIEVHPALVTLVPGWGNEPPPDPEPASWAPTRTERVRVLRCVSAGVMGWGRGESAFMDALAFVAPRKATKAEGAVAGVEWAFVNNDVSLQAGGYRWIAPYSLEEPRR